MNLLLTGDAKNDQKVKQAVLRKMFSRKMVDSVLRYKGRERWIATRHLWLRIWPGALEDHRDAVEEAAMLRRTILDPVYGRSRAALGKAPDQPKTNKNTQLRVLAVLPEELKMLLIRFDPFNLGPSASKRKENWKDVYRTFPEYKVPEKL